MARIIVSVQGTEYAQQVMSSIAPPTVPRRDMESTVFKGADLRRS